MRHIVIAALSLFVVAIADAPLVQAQTREFGGYECTDGCSGHAAGYDWAERNGITDGSDCSGNSNSFYEGCEAYTEDPYRGSGEDDDGNDIDR